MMRAAAGLQGGVAPGIPTVLAHTQQDTVNSSVASITMAVPSGVVAGQTLLAIIVSDSGTRTWLNTAGWVLESPSLSTTSDRAVYSRVAQAGEPASYVFTQNGAVRKAGFMLALSSGYFGGAGVPLIASPTITRAPPVAQVIAGLNLCVFKRGSTAGATLTVPAGTTQIGTTQNANNPTMAMFQREIPVATPATTALETTGSTTSFFGFQIAIHGEQYVTGAQVEYGAGGYYKFACPVGVSSLSGVFVGGGAQGGFATSLNAGGGGGALGYGNNIAVTPGAVYALAVGGYEEATTFTVGATTYTAPGGSGANGGALPTNLTGFRGGNGGTGAGNADANMSGGGGAGGYSSAGGGGRGGNQSNGSGASSLIDGAGGGGNGPTPTSGPGGGGVGLKGAGAAGVGGAYGQGGGGGSGGEIGLLPSGGKYGGGYGASTSSNTGLVAASGGARLVWPGTTRQFPSTNVDDI